MNIVGQSSFGEAVAAAVPMTGTPMVGVVMAASVF
jgi:hypothetical protein